MATKGKEPTWLGCDDVYGKWETTHGWTVKIIQRDIIHVHELFHTLKYHLVVYHRSRKLFNVQMNP